MSFKKITDAEKLEIVDLYRQSVETTSSLANRYGVSSSTIARLLKNSIPEAEYEQLTQRRRGARAGNEEETAPPPVATQLELNGGEPEVPPILSADPEERVETDSSRRSRRRSSAPERSPAAAISHGERSANDPPKLVIPAPLPRLPVIDEIVADSQERYFAPPVVPATAADDSDEDPETVNSLAAMFGEEIADGEDDDFADDDWDEDDPAADGTIDRLLTPDRAQVRVLPLSQANLPRTCYIVVDKFAEPIVRPLKDFADLGQISPEEIQQRTLPVFDDRRVAKRFSNQRTQRVIKVPDSRIFYKTARNLRSKGIGCLLIDGNIYSLN